MKNIFRKSQKGFTLIELLIVIALLGALAVGLIGAIDPFEQLKKGTDTGVRDLVSQVQTAVIRFYAVKNAFPAWVAAPAGEAIAVNGAIIANLAPAFAEIIAAGELRQDFEAVQGKKLDSIHMSLNTITNTLSVCYTPQSKSFQSDPSTKYNPNHSGAPVTDNTCTSQGGVVSCDWCIQ